MIEYTEKRIAAQAFNRLTCAVGWGTRDEGLVEEALAHTWYSICACENGRLIGYGRLIGDGTIFLYVQDVMVLPDWQGKGVGTQIMKRMVEKIEAQKARCPDLRVYLGASKGRESFYKQFGFVTRAEADLGEGMVWM
ncbi:MAG: GNAT family N-acetyltransferase [Eubacteriales bacterium]|nr:GNAT family N-acetyltransferase [Eubacteriales bacterium]